MTSRVLVTFAAIAFSVDCFAQPASQNLLSGCFPGASGLLGTTRATATGCESALQVRYFANLVVGDSFIDINNDGSAIMTAQVGGTTFNYSTANICVNVYAFDPAESMVSCCACKVTPNGLISLSARQDLISNTLTPSSPTAVTVKLLATTPMIQGTNPFTASESCNAAFPFGLNPIPGPTGIEQNIVASMHAWGTTIHAQPDGGTYGATETKFAASPLGIVAAGTPLIIKTFAEVDRFALVCGFIQSNGSGFGICKSCRAGALGAGRE